MGHSVGLVINSTREYFLLFWCRANNLGVPVSSLGTLEHNRMGLTVYTDSVWLGGSGGMFNCVGDHILQEINTLLLTRFRPYKIATKQKPRRGGGLRQINTCRRVPLQVNFYNNNILALLSISVYSFYGGVPASQDLRSTQAAEE